MGDRLELSRTARAAHSKRYPDSFEETTLEAVLADRAVGRLVVVGTQTDECVRRRCTGRLRGYDATLVSDAHTTEDLSPGARRRRTRSRTRSLLAQP